MFIALGYLSGLLGGILGLAIGWSYASMKSRDPQGQQYPHYDEATRRHGRWILTISLVSVIFWGARRLGWF